MHAVLINQFYPPARAPTGRLLRDLALALRERGHAVTVITSASDYGPGAEPPAAPPACEGMTVCRLGRGIPHRTGIWLKMLDFSRFFSSARQAISRLRPPPDVLVSMTTPPFCGTLAARMHARRRIPYILWCMDLYPEALAANGWLRPWNPLYRLLARLARCERSRAALTITLGADMTERVRRSIGRAAAAPEGDRIAEIPVWSHLRPAPGDRAAARSLRRSRGWRDDQTILLYSGHMGRAHDIDAFLALAGRLRDVHSRVRIVFCGTGPMHAEWRRRAGTRFEWLDPVPEPVLAAHLLSADVHLVSQKPAWTGIVVPSKYAAACALGRPVLFAGPADSSVAGWIRTADSGWRLAPGEPDALDAVVPALHDGERIRAKGRNAAAQGARCFAPGPLLERMTAALENATIDPD